MGWSTKPDLDPQLPEWPLPGYVYIEYSETVPITPNLDPQEYSIDAMLIGQTANHDERIITVFISRQGTVRNYKLDFDAKTGQVANTSHRQNHTHQQ